MRPGFLFLHGAPLTVLRDSRGFSCFERLREDPTIPEIFGTEAVVVDDMVRRFFKSVDRSLGAVRIAQHTKPMWSALSNTAILDWDSTVQPKDGHQGGAEIGYNPSKPGHRSLYPLLAVDAKTSAVPGLPIPRGRHGPCEPVARGNIGRRAVARGSQSFA